MNINGYCPKCNADFDGDLVIECPAKQGKTEKEVIEYASSYEGWEDFGMFNRWDRKIGIYDLYKDCTIKYKCPDCNQYIEREY